MKGREMWVPHHNYGLCLAITGYIWLLRDACGPVRAMCGKVHKMESDVAASSQLWGVPGKYVI